MKHSVTVVIENIEFKKDKVLINGLIVVDRDNLKAIIIGKNGSMLKEIGRLARIDIEKYLGKTVYLELYVKTIKDWRNKENIFNDLGINELEN